jgi:hypothetical protein
MKTEKCACHVAGTAIIAPCANHHECKMRQQNYAKKARNEEGGKKVGSPSGAALGICDGAAFVAPLSLHFRLSALVGFRRRERHLPTVPPPSALAKENII